MILIIFVSLFSVTSAIDHAAWQPLDSRPIPKWYDRAKIGISIYWGIYSVPSFGSDLFWWQWIGENTTTHYEFMKKNYPSTLSYHELAKEFKGEFFDAVEWAELIEKSGAKYVVLTGKHHEGFAMWPSKYTFGWNSMDLGPKRDIVGEISTALRVRKIHFGLYYYLMEWFHPLYLQDKAGKWNSSLFVDAKLIPEMKELVNQYKPELIWTDGEWEAPSSYWKSTKFLSWLYNESPVKNYVVTNDRWGNDTLCRHGDFTTCFDRFFPEKLPPKKWETLVTLDKMSKCYRRHIKLSDLLTSKELLTILVRTVSYGGNILINLGATKEGTIIPIFQKLLIDLGKWLHINGDAIYDTQPYTVQNDTRQKNVFYTAKLSSVYVIILDWPAKDVLELASLQSIFVNNGTTVTLSGSTTRLKWLLDLNYTKIFLPRQSYALGEDAWTLRISPAPFSKI